MLLINSVVRHCGVVVCTCFYSIFSVKKCRFLFYYNHVLFDYKSAVQYVYSFMSILETTYTSSSMTLNPTYKHLCCQFARILHACFHRVLLFAYFLNVFLVGLSQVECYCIDNTTAATESRT